MGKLIDADKLELDTEWSDYYDGFTSYSQSQINEAEEVKAIPLEKIKQARGEIDTDVRTTVKYFTNTDAVIDYVLDTIDELIEESEE